MTIPFAPVPLNPVFGDSDFRITGSSDATKKAAFEVDGFTTATTRTFTLPNADAVLSASASALTSGRVPFVTTGGLLTDSSLITWSGTTFAVGDTAAGSSSIFQCNGKLDYGNSQTAYAIGEARPTSYSTNASGAAYPFLEAGNLVHSPRISGAARDIIFSVAGTTADVVIKRTTGALIVGNNGTDDGTNKLQITGGASITGAVSLTTASSGLTIAKTSGTTLVVSSTAAACATFAGGITLGAASTMSVSSTGSVSWTVTNSNAGTGADARSVLQNDGGLQTLFLLGSSGNTGTYFTGRSRANTMFIGSGSALNALCIGFIGQDKPIVFGSNGTEVGGWTSGVIASGSFQVLYSGQSALAVTGGATFGAATTARSSIRLPHGTAPTSPVDGDMWTTTAGLFVRINGVTKTVTLT